MYDDDDDDDDDVERKTFLCAKVFLAKPNFHS
jgi:hypothetical protein